MDKVFKCGWCITNDCHNCRPEIIYEGTVWVCACTHEDRRPVTQSEWLGYHVDVDGRPE